MMERNAFPDESLFGVQKSGICGIGIPVDGEILETTICSKKESGSKC